MKRFWQTAKHLAGLLALACALAVALPPLVDAATPADVSLFGQELDLRPYLAALETDRRDIPIEKPGTAPDAADFMTLHAKGEGPTFRWEALGLANGGTAPRDLVITIADQGFVGSEVGLPRPMGPSITSIMTAGGLKLEPLPEVGRQAYAFTLEPGQKAAIAFEIDGAPLSAVTLWQRKAYDGGRDVSAFLRGALLGIAALLSIAMFVLYGFRSRPVFLAAGGFAVASLGFLGLEAGHLSTVTSALGLDGLTPDVARALVEGLMAAFLILYLTEVTELRRLMPVVGNLLALLGLIAFAVPVLGFADPILFTAIARAIFALTALGGFVLIFYLWRRGDAKAETALVSWGAILLWTFIALFAAMAQPSGTSISTMLQVALCAALVVMAFTLAHHAFSQGYLSRHFFHEAGRRALALAGARAYVWDWQADEGELHVGEELERVLGLAPGFLADAGVEGFLELMHPADRAAYLGAVEAAEVQGSGAIEREFRLRHGDGTWRWFQLRGRAMPGQGRRAIRCIGTLTDVTGAKRSEERLLNDAVYDAVTGLPNRALFLDRTARALADAVEEAPLYVLLLDIDRFKTVNDALGHEAGDSLLAVVGRRLTSAASSGDTVARLPGDQFAILTHGGRDIATYSDGMLKAVARPVTLDTQEVFLTVCAGVAQGRADGSATQLLKDAAIALYEAKRRGAGTIEVFSPAMRDSRAELMVLESELRRAIERNEIEVHYQPIARLGDMNLAGFEALVRWQHPALGLLAPESFIGLAEQTGMIKEIGRAVLNEACHQIGIWQRAYRAGDPLFVAVNISSVQLIEPDLIDDIKQMINREGVARGSLKIEVTESLVMQYPERAAQVLERLQELGVGLSCDDFGTGYSSLSNLRRLPFDTLKVDRSFLAADAEDSRAGIILETIVTMAHALGLTIVAEGIENQEQVDRLGALHCDLGQGYFIGRAMTARQVTEALAGLPYASGAGRTAITWLWERAAKDPAPVPLAVDVTAADIEELRARKASAERALREARLLHEQPEEPEAAPEAEAAQSRVAKPARIDFPEDAMSKREAAAVRKARQRKRKKRQSAEIPN
ncbi:EAL domain-containing protein [Aestuariivirga sp.]|uniref:EAL domain-containing protein n=1 Tax=Aestuariivirga sp. TaxID=2650926 RepID=UPI0039E56B3C